MMRARSDAVEIERERARLRAQGGALCDLLRQLQQSRHRRGGARGAGARTASRPRSSIPTAAACRSSSRAISRASPARRARSRRRSCPVIEEGYDIVALVPSCALMLKFEWPLLLPRTMPTIAQACRARPSISANTSSISPRRRAWRRACKPLPGGVSLHLACHARAQNMGAKAAEMLRLLPQPDLDVIERCSGHGGSWGVKKENFAVAMKVGSPAARQAAQGRQGVSRLGMPARGASSAAGRRRARGRARDARPLHPIELMALCLWARRRRSVMTTKMGAKRAITRADILDPRGSTPRSGASSSARSPRSSAIAASKSARSRRSISRITTRCGIRSTRCCYIERGGEAQIDDELAAYNPLIPQGDELIATVMFEIENADAARRARSRSSAASRTTCISRVGGERIARRPRSRRARTPRPKARHRRCSSCAFPSRRRRRRNSATPGAQVLCRHRPSELRPYRGDARSASALRSPRISPDPRAALAHHLVGMNAPDLAALEPAFDASGALDPAPGAAAFEKMRDHAGVELAPPAAASDIRIARKAAARP